MRLALFHNLPAGGAKRHTYEQVRELRKRGHHIEEFAFSTADCEFMSLREHVAAVHVYQLKWEALTPVALPVIGPYVHLVQNFLNLERLRRTSRFVANAINAEFDIALVKDCMFTIAPFVQAFLSIPVVFYAHTTLKFSSDDPLRSPKPNRLGIHLLARIATKPARQVHEALVWRHYVQNMRSADLVLTNSLSSQRFIKEQCAVEARVVHGGVDADTFRPVPGPREDYVLSVGAITEAKGHRLVIEALGRLPFRNRPALVVAGADGDPAECDLLRALSAQLGVKLSIRQVRATNEMVELYGRAQALVVGHFYEYLGNNALEALACGTPVVAVDPRGLVENVIHGVNGILVKERTATAMGEGLRQLLADPIKLEDMRRSAREYVQSYWTWPRAVDDLEAQFAAALEQGKVR